MKKFIAALVVLFTLTVLLASCSASHSDKYYDEISSYVNEHKSSISHAKETEYYFYDTIADTNENTYYGYYYSENNEILPCGQDKMELSSAYSEGDGGYYFGEVSKKSDWSFVKKIDSSWYYFEAHDYIYD